MSKSGKKAVSAWAALLVITLAAALALGVTNEVTKGPIALQSEQTAQQNRQALIPNAEFTDVTNVYTGEAQGFAGPVAVTFSLDEEGKIQDLTIGDSRFAETPSLGGKAQEEGFAEKYTGKTLPLSDSDVEVISGATITSKAVAQAINDAQSSGLDSLYEAKIGDETAGYVGTITVNGFGGEVEVTVGMDAQGIITGIAVGGSNFSETAGLGAKSKEPAFTGQFAGKTTPLSVTKSGDATETQVDAITSATITSNAVTGGVNTVGECIKQKLGLSEKIVLPELDETTALQGEAQGFAGVVSVKINVENGKISAIKIGDERFSETEGFGAKALEDSFAYGYIGKSLPLTEADIEVVSGATYTTKAVFNAINQAYAGSAAGEGSADVKTSASVTTSATVQATEAPVQTDAPADVATSASVTTSATTVSEETIIEEPIIEEETPANTVSASAKGFGGDVTVTFTLDENGIITAVDIQAPDETPGFGKKAEEEAFKSQFIGKTLPIESVDAITGATITTNAVKTAIASMTGEAEEAPADVETSASVTTSATAQVTEAPVQTEAPADVETSASVTTSATTVSEEPIIEEETDANTVSASAKGFGGDVTVTFTLDENGVITAVDIQAPGETPGFGKKAEEEAFKAQFIGKTLPIESVDAITGATITTNAVITAINALSAQ